jgi:hypothetical protein
LRREKLEAEQLTFPLDRLAANVYHIFGRVIDFQAQSEYRHGHLFEWLSSHEALSMISHFMKERKPR